MIDKLIFSQKATILEIGYSQAKEELNQILIRKAQLIKSIYEKDLTEKSLNLAKAEDSLIKINLGFQQSSEDLIEELKIIILGLHEKLSLSNLEVQGYKAILWRIDQSRIKIWENEERFKRTTI